MLRVDATALGMVTIMDSLFRMNACCITTGSENMDWLTAIDWDKVFTLDMSLLEIFLRGTIMYLTIFFLFRTPLRRLGGTLAVPDVLVIVFIADAAQNGMAGEYQSIPSGIMLVLTILFWSFALDWLSYKYTWVRKLVQPSPVPLIKDGQMQRRNMQRDHITREELLSQLREQGIDKASDVKSACIEGNGHISIIKKDEEQIKPQEVPIA